MGECWTALDGYSLVWISYRPKPQCCSAKRNQLFKLRTSRTSINIVWAQSSWSTTKNYTLQGTRDGSVGDCPPAITRESWPPPPPREGPWLAGRSRRHCRDIFLGGPLAATAQAASMPLWKALSLSLSIFSFLPFSAEGLSCVLSGNQDV